MEAKVSALMVGFWCALPIIYRYKYRGKTMAFPLALIAVAGLAGYSGYRIGNSRKEPVPISYYSMGDSHYRDFVTDEFNGKNQALKLIDLSSGLSHNDKIDPEEQALRKTQIEKARCIIVFIGEETHQQETVCWEIEEAKRQEKPIIAIKVKHDYKSPIQLRSYGVIWLTGLSEEKLQQILGQI